MGARNLRPWEEAAGILRAIRQEGPAVVIHLGKVQIRLGPAEAAYLKDQLKEELIGEKISVLRTDMPERPALLRRLN